MKILKLPTLISRIFSELVRIPAAGSTIDTQGKEKVTEPAQTEAPSKDVTIEDSSKQEIEEILKIIRKSDYNIVEQLGQTPSKISMLSLLLCSEAHAQALVKFLKTAHVPQETFADQFEICVASLIADNGLGFSDADLTPTGKNHNKSMHVSIECRGTTLAHVLVDIGSSLNVLPKGALDRLDCEGVVLKPSDIMVRAFDGSRRMVHRKVDLPIKVGSQVFDSTFYVMDIRPTIRVCLDSPGFMGHALLALPCIKN